MGFLILAAVAVFIVAAWVGFAALYDIIIEAIGDDA